ncbi:MAG: hypothetical protein IKG22_14345 [Atopobiaceae bacterium]|nr:hypothetical protein [Atopobiaceae bacterium]
MQRRIHRSTGVRCYPDKTDADGKVVKQDNRGKGAAEDSLRKWFDELIAKEVVEPETPRYDATLYDYAKEYFDLLHVKEGTRSGYRAALSHLIGTEAGNTKLYDLSPPTTSTPGRSPCTKTGSRRTPARPRRQALPHAGVGPSDSAKLSRHVNFA